MRTYTQREIQKVYSRHHSHPGTVLFTNNAGLTWQVVGIDTGKWNIQDWLFTFVLDKHEAAFDPKADCGHCFDGVIMFTAINDLSTGITMGTYDAATCTEDAIAQNAMWFTEWWIVNIRPHLKDPVDLSKVEWRVHSGKNNGPTIKIDTNGWNDFGDLDKTQ